MTEMGAMLLFFGILVLKIQFVSSSSLLAGSFTETSLFDFGTWNLCDEGENGIVGGYSKVGFIHGTLLDNRTATGYWFESLPSAKGNRGTFTLHVNSNDILTGTMTSDSGFIFNVTETRKSTARPTDLECFYNDDSSAVISSGGYRMQNEAITLHLTFCALGSSYTGYYIDNIGNIQGHMQGECFREFSLCVGEWEETVTNDDTTSGLQGYEILRFSEQHIYVSYIYQDLLDPGYGYYNKTTNADALEDVCSPNSGSFDSTSAARLSSTSSPSAMTHAATALYTYDSQSHLAIASSAALSPVPNTSRVTTSSTEEAHSNHASESTSSRVKALVAPNTQQNMIESSSVLYTPRPDWDVPNRLIPRTNYKEQNAASRATSSNWTTEIVAFLLAYIYMRHILPEVLLLGYMFRVLGYIFSLICLRHIAPEVL